MGFKTLAIQKRSSEVWNVLSAVKTEFDNFEKVLEKTKSRLESANKELDTLVGVRTRAINRKLKEVSTLEQSEAEKLIGVESIEE
jgi:DNA recombination protein RmuC